MDDVRIYNRALNGKEVDELFNIQGSIITNTKSISSLSTVTIFPSPSNGKFNIGSKTENETFTEIEIYDNKGLSVYKEYNNLGIHTQLDLSHLFHGLYFIKLKTNNNIYNEKIIIQ